jgi:hypothetical protein
MNIANAYVLNNAEDLRILSLIYTHYNEGA